MFLYLSLLKIKLKRCWTIDVCMGNFHCNHLCLRFAFRDLFTFNPSVDRAPAISYVVCTM